MLVTIDGVSREIPLEHMDKKDAVFVPTLNNQTTRGVLRRITNELGYEVTMRSMIHEGFLGVMVWRTE